MVSRRVLALAAILLAVAAVAVACVQAVTSFPDGELALVAFAAALALAWVAIFHRGSARAMAAAAALTMGVAIVFLVSPLNVLLIAATTLGGLGAARTAFRMPVALPRAERPQHPVLFYNPRSGGGKAERFHLEEEARRRGVEPVELTPGTDLETLVRDAVAHGADALGMAGGDGSQAVVAAVAAEHGLPYVCVPAGTRNHFALDLGVDRDDVVGALDAFVDGGERIVDLAEVNGRIFVNNVSLGVYAEAVQQEGYRDAKLRTLLRTAPTALAPGTDGSELRWQGPEGAEHRAGAAILVSNNAYRLGRAVGSGTRPRLDAGRLGVAVVGIDRAQARAAGSHRGWLGWSAPTFRVDATGPVAAGIDGEALVLEPPLVFRSRPAALRCRIAPEHPGASPSAFMPDGPMAGLRALARIAAGHDPREQGAIPAGAPAAS